MSFRQTSYSSWIPYAAAVGLTAVAAAVRVWLAPDLDPRLAWLTFYPAVAVAAIYGGLRTGLLATALACLTAGWLMPLLIHTPGGQLDWQGGLAFVGTGTLIASVSHAMRRALARVESLQTLVASMDEGFCVIDMIRDQSGRAVDYRFIEINPAFVAQTGLVDARGRTIRSMVPDHEEHWFEIYDKVARTGEDIRFEQKAAALGRYYDVFAFRIGGRKSHRVGVLFKDILDRKNFEAELLQLAQYDKLTGLPNRTMFHDYLVKALARAERSRRPVALMFLDLDDFKIVNDQFGHQAGDNLLRAAAQRLLSCMRAGDLVSRLGGDEFTIVVENCPPGLMASLAEKVIQVLDAPFEMDGRAARISTSIGIASYPDSATDEATLIRRADAAMYAAKKDGRNRYRIWNAAEFGSAA